MPRIAGNRYVIFKIYIFLWKRSFYALLLFTQPASGSTNGTNVCAQSVLVASGRAAQSDDIEVPFIGNNICGPRVSLHSSAIGHTGLVCGVCSLVYVFIYLFLVQLRA